MESRAISLESEHDIVVARGEVRALAAALFFAGLARAGGWLAVGRPSRLQRRLLVIELAAPPAVVVWQSRLASAS